MLGAPWVRSGGHCDAHAPVHVEVLLVSASNRYKALPEESVRAIENFGVPTLRAAPPDVDGEDGEDGVDGEDEYGLGAEEAGGDGELFVVLLPHPAAKVTALTATATSVDERRTVRMVDLLT